MLTERERLARTDEDGDGWNALEDCDDFAPKRNPGALERCDGLDDNCNGWVDEGLYPDKDLDGYGGVGDGPCFADWIPIAGDCDDSRPYVHPDQEERCDGLNTACQGSWEPSTDAGLVTWSPVPMPDNGPDPSASGTGGPWERAVDFTDRFAEGARVDLPATGWLQICGRPDPYRVTLQVEEFEDLAITGIPIQSGDLMQNVVINGGLNDGVPVVEASSDTGRLRLYSRSGSS